MEIGEFIFLLNGDASREAKAEVQYEAHAAMLNGAESISLQKLYREHAGQERGHRLLIYDMIVFLGGQPVPEMEPIAIAIGNAAMFLQDKESEVEAIARYTDRYGQAMSLGLVTCAYDLIEIIGEERDHLNELRSIMGAR